MKKSGTLVVFEGPDGTGKSTLAKALQNYFLSQDESWELLAFPGNEKGSLGKHIYELHHHPHLFELSRIYPECLQILHIAAHIDNIENRIKPVFQKGQKILLDRYWWSTWVYGISSGVDPQALEMMINLEEYHWHDILPDAVIFVDRSNSLRKEIDPEDWLRLRAFYYELAEREKNKYPVFILENNGEIETTLANLVNIIKINQVSQRVNVTNMSPLASNHKKEEDQENKQLVLPFMNTPKNEGEPRFYPARLSKIFPVIPTKVYDTYWYFAAERQNIFYKRIAGCPPPWTDDPILAQYKFTNAYRASDRVSQYLIKRVIYQGDQSPEELFFRILLFKVFNRISTWEMVSQELGEITFNKYSFNNYDQVLTLAMKRGRPIFSAAYIMPSGGKDTGYPLKHQVFLKLIERMIADKVPSRLAAAPSMRSAFEILRSYPLMGDFLAYQYVIDINYSTLTNFSESEFVMPGPGARDGLRKCFENFGGLSEIDLIRLVTDIQEEEFARLGIDFRSLWGRRLQLIDCQNLFCEVDKYARVAHPEIEGIKNRKRIKQMYKQDRQAIDYWYPPKWGLNHLIK